MCSIMETLKKVGKWILRWRFGFIPPLILCLFTLMIILCKQHAPDHYTLHKVQVFHISAFGNWQEGLGFFSGGLVIIGSLVYCLADEMYIQRIETEVCDVCCLSCRCRWIFKLGYLLVYFGFVITGCFQQSYNKPGHNIGLASMAVGFIVIFVFDACYFNCNIKRNPSTLEQRRVLLLVVGISQVVLFAIVIISGICLYIFHIKSKSEWDGGFDKAWKLKQQKFNSSAFEECPVGRFNDWLWRDETDYSNYQFECKSKGISTAGVPGLKIYKISTQEVTNLAELSDCPNRTVNDWLKGKEYPYFYPCKSKSLWAPEDPGWKYYEWSASFEIALFVFLAIYTFTYWGHLKPREDPSYWFYNTYHPLPVNQAIELEQVPV